MDSPMLKMIKQQNPDKEYPEKLGEKWTIEEEKTLLQELDENTLTLKDIAESHKRTQGGIIGRQKTIAYSMYLAGATEDEIIRITKLTNEQLIKTIAKKGGKTPLKYTATSAIQPPIFSLEKETIEVRNEMNEMRNEMNELKTTINELVDMIKAIYQFKELPKGLQTKYLMI
jgi:mevalonate pyrophosphate decarboxylase